MPSFRAFIIVLIAIFAVKVIRCHQKTTKIVVGFLPAIKGDLKERQGLAISGAMTYALDQINNSTVILPNVELELRFHDTRGDIVTSTRALTDMLCDGVSAIFGPEGTSCYVEAMVTQSKNIPMLAYVNLFLLIQTTLTINWNISNCRNARTTRHQKFQLLHEQSHLIHK